MSEIVQQLSDHLRAFYDGVMFNTIDISEDDFDMDAIGALLEYVDKQKRGVSIPFEAYRNLDIKEIRKLITQFLECKMGLTAEDISAIGTMLCNASYAVLREACVWKWEKEVQFLQDVADRGDSPTESAEANAEAAVYRKCAHQLTKALEKLEGQSCTPK